MSVIENDDTLVGHMFLILLL